MVDYPKEITVAGLFSKPKAPQVVYAPASPSASDNVDAERQRAAAERAAIAKTAGENVGGRRSTIVAGMKIAMDEQEEVGLKSQRRREAARVLGG